MRGLLSRERRIVTEKTTLGDHYPNRDIRLDGAAMPRASAREKPQIMFSGQTNPFHWHPVHKHAIILFPNYERPQCEFIPRHRRGRMREMAAEPVTRAIDLALHVF